MNIEETHISRFDRVYFIGIGGIGMSALARYFSLKGWQVAGYDKTETTLTRQLEKEGIAVHYEDLGTNIPTEFKNSEKTLVVFTPAIPKEMAELVFVQQNGFAVHKRAAVLGMITRDSKALGVAGTHGKTTTSTMLAHLLTVSPLKCSAFLGGISTNFNSNFVSGGQSDLTVIEADEFDRSFLQLNPFAAIVTSTDADHLDIYGDKTVFHQGFQDYVDRISPEGFLIRHFSVDLHAKRSITYGLNCKADYIGSNLRFEKGVFQFDVETPLKKLKAIELGIPGIHNAENAIACIAMGIELGLEEAIIREGLSTFAGVKRRFEYHLRTEKLVYIDDYAHHPTEIEALISSVKLLYPGKRITGIFQPHLFSRTRDFFEGFVHQLSRLGEVVLLPIYPARESPIEGITSEALCDAIWANEKSVLSPSDAIAHVSKIREGVILTIGAGDIDLIVEPLKKELENQ